MGSSWAVEKWNDFYNQLIFEVLQQLFALLFNFYLARLLLLPVQSWIEGSAMGATSRSPRWRFR